MRSPQPIKTVSYVHAGGRLVNIDDLSAEQRQKLATWLKTTYLNNLYAGRAVFRHAEEKETRSEGPA